MLICGRLFSARGSVSSVLICGRFFSARSFCAFRAFCGNIFSPTEFTESTEFGSVGMAGMPYPPNLCSSVSSVGGSSLQEVLCIRCIPWELLHRLFGWCSSCSGKRQSRAETAAPPGGIHRSSVQISPFHLEPSLLHVLPVLWVRLRHYLRFVNPQPREHDCRRCERHRHAVVVVGVDRL